MTLTGDLSDAGVRLATLTARNIPSLVSILSPTVKVAPLQKLPISKFFLLSSRLLRLAVAGGGVAQARVRVLLRVKGNNNRREWDVASVNNQSLDSLLPIVASASSDVQSETPHGFPI